MNATYHGVPVPTESQRDSGFPIPRATVKYGHMTFDEIMTKADKEGLVSSVKTGHNEMTLAYENGVVVCRLRETDIVVIDDSCDLIMIDTGGWNTLTTRRHIVDFLACRGITISLWGDKKAGGNVLTVRRENATNRITFNQRVMFDRVGGICSDLDGVITDMRRTT